MDVYQRRRLVALSAIIGVFIIVVILIGRGCGDDEPEAPPITTVGGTTSDTAATLAKSDYIEEADAICTESNAALAALDTSTAEGAADQAELVSGELDQLQTLPSPDEDADAADRFLRALSEQVNALEERQTALEQNDTAGVTGAETTLATAEAAAQEAAEEFGFEVCGDPAETGGVEEPAPTDVAPVAPAPTAPVEPAPAPDTGGDTGGTGGGDSGSGGVSP